MSVILSLVLFTLVGSTLGQKNLHFLENRTTVVQLFEWTWEDVAAECERFLGPNGYAGVQVSPVVENIIVANSWWEKYQTMSYKLDNRAGNETAFAKMVRKCTDNGVRIYVDVVINHMTGTHNVSLGTAGSTANFSEWSYPAVPYDRSNFHSPRCTVRDHYNATEVRVCELANLKDLNTTSEYVREKLVTFLDRLVDHGVAGFRVDAAIHVSSEDMKVIFNRLKNLSEAHGFPPGARAFVNQEVIDVDGAISRQEYTAYAAVTEYRGAVTLGKAFGGKNPLKDLMKFGPELTLVESEDSFYFIDNHDNQRQHSHAAPDILTHKTPRSYKAATAFMLAHPYGTPCVMSSYYFTDEDAGPPSDINGNILSPSILPDGTCGNGWVCEHRWKTMRGMTGFRNHVVGTPVTSWWDNGNNQIAFCRGNKGFIVINMDNGDLNQNLQTCLPAGTYCDVVTGGRNGTSCLGKIIVVSSAGDAPISISSTGPQAVIAIHTGLQSKL